VHPRRKVVFARRAKSIPTMLLATIVALAGLPLIAPVAIAADLVRFRFKLPLLRVYLFTLQYLFNDSVEILAAPLLWLTRAPLGRYEQLQWWSVDLMMKRADQLLGLRVKLEPDGLVAVQAPDDEPPRPLIVISRHVSILDSTLPGLLLGAADRKTTGVMMAEMLADPGFDLVYGRIGWVFVSRDDRQSALKEIGKFHAVNGTSQAVMMFPEGRLFRPEVRDRALARLAEVTPGRAERLAGLRNTLPPRPAGMLALLELLPEADVAVISHSGLDDLCELAQLGSVAPLHRDVMVTARRISRSEIPADADQQVAWLDELWLEIDAPITPSNRSRALPQSV
jgi:hypothetical protein